MTSLVKDVKVTRVMNAVAAGTSNQSSTFVDMANFDSVAFVVSFGTITASAVTSVRLQGSASSDGSSPTNIGSGVTVADTDDNKQVVVEVNRPASYRYVGVIVNRATANAVIDGVSAFQTGSRVKPVTQPSSCLGSEFVLGS